MLVFAFSPLTRAGVTGSGVKVDDRLARAHTISFPGCQHFLGLCKLGVPHHETRSCIPAKSMLYSPSGLPFEIVCIHDRVFDMHID
jgi:hypothetical protein